MISEKIILTPPPPPSNGTGEVVVNVAGTPLAGVLPDTFVGVNPTGSVNAATFGLIVARVSAPDVITFTVKNLNAPTEVLVSVP